MSTEITPVIFRFKDYGPGDGSEVVAIFPCEPYNSSGSISCYASLGQHSGCSFDWYYSTRRASESEYSGLKSELESLGYNLQIYKRMTKGHRSQFTKAMRR